MVSALPATRTVWGWLAEVVDPEIPVVSVTELGIVRSVDYDKDTLVVTITPTYSGCPATALIGQMIEARLQSEGVEQFRVDQRLSPPWTTDWLTDDARRKLRAFGIAPPVDGTAATSRPAARAARLADDSRPAIACPHCGSAHTEQLSHFGSTPCKAAYRCNDCLEPFEYFKCI